MNRLVIKFFRFIPLIILLFSLLGFVTLLCYPIIEGNTFWLLLWSCGITAIVTILYLIYDRKKGELVLDETVSCLKVSIRTICTLDIVYYLGLSLLLAVIFFNEVRPYFYVLFLAVLSVIIAFQVLISPKKSVIYHALFKIITLFSIASLSIFKTYYWTGRDTWTHAVWNIQLAEEGHLFAGLGKELSTPLYHIAVAVGEIISGLDVRSATILMVTIPLLIIVSLSVYSVAKLIILDQYAIIAVIIADFIGFLPYWSTLGQSTTYACMLFAVLLIPLFRLFIVSKSGSVVAWGFLLVGLVLSVALSHLYSTFILVLYLCGFVFTYFIVDFKRKRICPQILIVCIGIIVAVGYSCFHQLPMMLRVFEIGFSKLGSILESAGVTSLQFLPSSAVKESAVLDAIQLSLQNCFTLVVDDNVWLFFWSSALKFLLLVVPFVLACLFIARRCCNLKVGSFEQSMWYLLVPAFVLFALLVITSVAYPPMSDRPWYYLPLFQGLLLASILWYYTAHRKKSGERCSRYSWVNIVIVLSIVAVAVLGGGLVTLMNSDNPGIFKEEMVSYGHSEKEIDGLATVVEYMPGSVSFYVDNEMRGPINYITSLSTGGQSILNKNILTYDVQNNYDNSYLLFRHSLIGEATYYPLSAGGSELETVWNEYRVGTEYPTLLSLINTLIYDNGELYVYILDN